MSLPFRVLYEDNHLLVVAKPPGLPTMGVRPGQQSLVTAAKGYLKRKYQKPGNVYLGVVSRLDRDASGVLPLARTSKAARRLTEQFRTGRVEKTYWAIVERPPDPESGRCEDYLRKDERLKRVVACRSGAAGAKRAVLAYRLLKRLRGGRALVEIQLETGRKHQIRVQLARRGWPILGDRKYGARTPFPAGLALHARRLAFAHPVRQATLSFTAPPPRTWRAFGVRGEETQPGG